MEYSGLGGLASIGAFFGASPERGGIGGGAGGSGVGGGGSSSASAINGLASPSVYQFLNLESKPSVNMFDEVLQEIEVGGWE